MIKSMTGFGKAEVAIPDKKITVEIRTLNSKQLDLAVCPGLPPVGIRNPALAPETIQRGKGRCLSYRRIAPPGRRVPCIDEELFHLYYNQLLKICREQPEIGHRDAENNDAILHPVDPAPAGRGMLAGGNCRRPGT